MTPRPRRGHLLESLDDAPQCPVAGPAYVHQTQTVPPTTPAERFTLRLAPRQAPLRPPWSLAVSDGVRIHARERDTWCCLPTERTPAPAGWSVYGAQQAQAVAITGKSPCREIRENKPDSLPCVAIRCLRRQMVRRGSTSRFAPGLCDPFAARETGSRAHPTLFANTGNDSSRADPARGSRKLPQVPANPRNGSAGKPCTRPQIPAYPRSGRKPHDRPVTPEVAGSSPVAPVSLFVLQDGWICCLRRRPQVDSGSKGAANHIRLVTESSCKSGLSGQDALPLSEARCRRCSSGFR
jgi:hypothetical protein